MARLAFTARIEEPRPYDVLSKLACYIFKGWGLIDLPLRAAFSPAHPLARRDVPLTRARAFQFDKPQFKGVAKAALYCAHRTSTFLSCAFCEQEGQSGHSLSPPLRELPHPLFHFQGQPGRSSIARIERNKYSLQARSLSLRDGG